jgi:hypothetical protein
MDEFERSGVLRVKDIMSDIVWIPYRETKPEFSGLYLVKGDKTTPQFKGAYWYDPIHGWSGLAHALENIIEFYAQFPE